MKRLMVVAMLVAGQARAGAVLIGNAQTPAGALDRDSARKLLLGEMLFWPSGAPVEVFEVRADEPAIEAGYLELTNKTLTQVRAAWNRLIFAGKAEPPVRVGTSGDAKAVVAKRPGSVALVDSSAVDGSVRVLLRLP